jgi:hypothetical protein
MFFNFGKKRDLDITNKLVITNKHKAFVSTKYKNKDFKLVFVLPNRYKTLDELEQLEQQAIKLAESADVDTKTKEKLVLLFTDNLLVNKIFTEYLVSVKGIKIFGVRFLTLKKFKKIVVNNKKILDANFMDIVLNIILNKIMEA